MTPDSSLDDVFSIIAQRVVSGATLLRHRPLGGGVSAEVHALEITSAGGRSGLVVRRHGAAGWKALADDVTAREFRLLAAIHAAGLRVPEPLLLDVSGELLPSPFLVVSLVEGSTTIEEASRDAALRQMASFLARLHQLEWEALDLPELEAREDPVSGVLEYLSRDERWVPVRDAVAAYAVGEHAVSLLHGDFWPGNVMWADGELAAVIDWEDAALGPAVSDVACCRAELNAMFGEAAMHAFTRYYGEAYGELSDLALWDLYVGAAALGTMHAWGLPPDVEATRRARTTTFVERAAGELLRAS